MTMQTIADLFTRLGIFFVGPWLWFVLAVLMFLLESIIPGIHFMWFGTAALAVFGLTLAVDVPWAGQLIAFAALSVATLYWVRRYSPSGSEVSDQPNLNVKGAEYVGRTFVVEDAIAGGRGKLRVGDTLWSAEGPALAKGAQARVTGINGTVLIVEPA
jgi:inner membrane protein